MAWPVSADSKPLSLPAASTYPAPVAPLAERMGPLMAGSTVLSVLIESTVARTALPPALSSITTVRKAT